MDLVRNVNMLQEYDYAYRGQKTHEYKGIFVSSKHAREFETYLLEKSNKQKSRQTKETKKAYAGKIPIDEKYDGLSSAEIKKQIATEKFGE